MIARSIHPIPEMPVEETGAPGSVSPATAKAPRVRRMTNDPAREYAQRPGEVERLPDDVAALILCKKGWAKIERHQIKISLDGEELVFASRESIVITAKNGNGERVLWAVNRRAPELLHLLTNDGGYIESLPRKGQATWFSSNEESQRAYADAQAMIQRDARRLRELHADDTAEAARDAQENAASTQRIVNAFPATEGESCEGKFPRAERLATAMAAGEHRRAAGAESEREVQRREAKTLQIGEAMRDALFADAAED